MRVSFAVHSYNEAEALRRLVLSSLPMAGLFDEWVIADHRSDDHTPAIIEKLRVVLKAHGLGFRTFREPRDLSADYTFADIRNATIEACSHPIVALCDADFIFGPAFAGLLKRAVAALGQPGSIYYGAAYAVPCVWDRLRTDARGRVIQHGRIWVHQIRDRIFIRDAVHYEQVGSGGRWERLKRDDPKRQARLPLTRNRRSRPTPNTVLSVNVKPPERIALRDTMTMFMQDAMQGKVSGTWLENHAAGKTRNQPAYAYQRHSLRGWLINAPNLNLAA